MRAASMSLVAPLEHAGSGPRLPAAPAQRLHLPKRFALLPALRPLPSQRLQDVSGQIFSEIRAGAAGERGDDEDSHGGS
jgi:hypothetical protein